MFACWANLFKKMKKTGLKIKLRKARWEVLCMMSDEQRTKCLTEDQYDIYLYEKEAEWTARLEPELSVDTTPDELYQALKGIFRMEALSYPHISVILCARWQHKN